MGHLVPSPQFDMGACTTEPHVISGGPRGTLDNPEKVDSLQRPRTSEKRPRPRQDPITPVTKRIRINQKGTKQVLLGKKWRRACVNQGCDKSAEGSTEYCVNHGGGKRCSK